MPELPEVETIRRGLEKKIVGLTIKNLQILNSKSVQFNPKIVEGQKVLNIWRRAKMLGIDLAGKSSIVNRKADSNDKRQTTNDKPESITLLFHLKMTGQLIYIPNNNRRTINDKRLIGGHPTEDMKGQMPSQSTRAIFEFSDGSKLYFNDQRKFGWVKVVSSQSSAIRQLLDKLGPEPFDPEFTWEILKNNLLKHKSMPIKVAIMDQGTLAGVGNIYASESLFLAKIDPRRKVSSLSDEEFKKLFTGIRKSLEVAIEKGGSTRAHFVNIDGEKGYFLDYANVYGKEGYPCTGCSGKVQKIQQAGRGTYWCPSCQK